MSPDAVDRSRIDAVPLCACTVDPVRVELVAFAHVPMLASKVAVSPVSQLSNDCGVYEYRIRFRGWMFGQYGDVWFCGVYFPVLFRNATVNDATCAAENSLDRPNRMLGAVIPWSTSAVTSVHTPGPRSSSSHFGFGGSRTTPGRVM
jgi:hypothetical protein